MAERLPVGASRNIKSPTSLSSGSNLTASDIPNGCVDRVHSQLTFQDVEPNVSNSQLLSNGSSNVSNHNAVQNRQGFPEPTTRNGGRTKEGDSRNENEWVEQDEPGVYITLTSLPAGVKDLKRVRFRCVNCGFRALHLMGFYPLCIILVEVNVLLVCIISAVDCLSICVEHILRIMVRLWLCWSDLSLFKNILARNGSYPWTGSLFFKILVLVWDKDLILVFLQDPSCIQFFCIKLLTICFYVGYLWISHFCYSILSKLRCEI